MTALVHPPTVGRAATPAVWLCPPGTRPSRPVATRPTPGARPTAAQFRRRRTAVSFTAAVLLGGLVALGVPGGVPLTPSGRAPAAWSAPVGNVVPIAQASYVVQPGDTLWRIARALQPDGDIRPLVQRLASGRAGAPLRAGERLVLAG